MIRDPLERLGQVAILKIGDAALGVFEPGVHGHAHRRRWTDCPACGAPGVEESFAIVLVSSGATPGFARECRMCGDRRPVV